MYGVFICRAITSINRVSLVKLKSNLFATAMAISGAAILLAGGESSLRAGTLLRNDFESDSWAGKSVYSNNVAVTASVAYGNYGTITNFGGSTGSM